MENSERHDGTVLRLVDALGTGTVATDRSGTPFRIPPFSAPARLRVMEAPVHFGRQVTLLALTTGANCSGCSTATRTFLGWSGDCTGSALTCVVTIDKPEKRITAMFSPPP